MVVGIIIAAVVGSFMLGALVSICIVKYQLNKKHGVEIDILHNEFKDATEKAQTTFKKKLEKIDFAVQTMQSELDKNRERMHIALTEKKAIEEKYRELSIRFMQYGDPDSKETPNVSYKNNAIDVSKRVQEAIRPWQIRVEELQSQIDLLNMTKSDTAILKEKELLNKINLLEAEISKKEEENVDLTLKVNKAIMAYDALNKRYKALL